MLAGLALLAWRLSGEQHAGCSSLRINAAGTDSLPSALWASDHAWAARFSACPRSPRPHAQDPATLAGLRHCLPHRWPCCSARAASSYFDIMRPAGVLEPESFQPDRPEALRARLSRPAMPPQRLRPGRRGTHSRLAQGWPHAGGRRWAFSRHSLASLAFSRVAVGAHWPLDVLAGAAGGWIGRQRLAYGCPIRLPAFWPSRGGVRIMATIVPSQAAWPCFSSTLGQPEAHLYQHRSGRLGHWRRRRSVS
jgi:hypothetical protein